ncbi:hypothetical protein [uncultured Piscinibacter sp.]|uniref:hypothetical protein n=1 Tax=uncultured Piscinibacter sp. TaxID=1131835 RepID=UPI002631A522|nr:hypothetical protein [uncultured Piscinibacter sp.]
MGSITKTTRRHRSAAIAQRLIGLSISYERDPLLARGLGLEHLRELLVRLARPLLRTGANLAYAGSWVEREDNFTYELLRLISAEQEDNSIGGPDSNLAIGRLVNHLSWPVYLSVTPRVEAQWIHCCHIVRVTQQMADIAGANVLPDDTPIEDDRRLLNTAVTLSAMRRLATQGMLVPYKAIPTQPVIPPMSARIVLGGKLTGYSGFMPGVLEEARLAIENRVPLYVLGGFGGASEALARALLAHAPHTVAELESAWHFERTPALVRLRDQASKTPLPPGMLDTTAGLRMLSERINAARPALADQLLTGLDEAQTREMMSTTDARRAVELVLSGMSQRLGFEVLPT